MSATLIHGKTSGGGTHLPAKVVAYGDGTGAFLVNSSTLSSVGAMLTCAPAAVNGAYAIGDCIGTVMTPSVGAGTAPPASGMIRITGVRVTDQAGQNAALSILLFDATPTGTFTDNNPVAITTMNQLRRIVQIEAADYATIDGKGIADLRNLSVDIPTDASGLPFVVVMSRGTPNYGASASSALRVLLFVQY